MSRRRPDSEERGGRLALVIGSLVLTSALPGWGPAAVREGLEGARWLLREEAHAERAPGAREVTELLRDGERAAQDGRADAAVRIFTRAVIADPVRPDAYAGLAEACLSLGDEACARRAYRALARALEARRTGAARGVGAVGAAGGP